MKMTDIWTLYEADKRILSFSPHTLKVYSLQFKVLTREIGNLNIGDLKITCDTPRERALLEFLYCTGCRVGEVHRTFRGKALFSCPSQPLFGCSENPRGVSRSLLE